MVVGRGGITLLRDTDHILEQDGGFQLPRRYPMDISHPQNLERSMTKDSEFQKSTD